LVAPFSFCRGIFLTKLRQGNRISHDNLNTTDDNVGLDGSLSTSTELQNSQVGLEIFWFWVYFDFAYLFLTMLGQNFR
jgi:hypothetical protein